MLDLLRKVPFLGTAIDFVTSKARLVIEYALIGVLVAVAGFTFALWLEKQRTQEELATVQGRVAGLETASELQDKEIGTLKELRLKDSQALGGLLSDFKDLARRDQEARKRLDELERSNETVRNYLNTSIPPELACLLNATCGAQGGAADAAGGAAR